MKASILYFLVWSRLVVETLSFLVPHQRSNPSCFTVLLSEYTRVILYHKPANIITSHSNSDAAPSSSPQESNRKTVYEDVLSMVGFTGLPSASSTTSVRSSFQEVTGIQSKLHAVGRLDADTTGLLLLTNDGGLVHHVTNPNAHNISSALSSCASVISKTYHALIMGHHEDNSPGLVQLRDEGADIGAKYGGMTKPAKHLQVLEHPTNKTTLVSITIEEGKNRQVRRMFHAIQSGVMRLKRQSIGEFLTLDGVETEGQWRMLTNREIRGSLGWEPREVARPRPSTPNRRRRRKR